MYTPIGERLIVEKPKEQKTDSGIILTEQDNWVKTVTVVNAGEHTRFAGKTLLVERRNFEDFGDGYGSVKIENIMAVKDA